MAGEIQDLIAEVVPVSSNAVVSRAETGLLEFAKFVGLDFMSFTGRTQCREGDQRATDGLAGAVGYYAAHCAVALRVCPNFQNSGDYPEDQKCVSEGDGERTHCASLHPLEVQKFSYIFHAADDRCGG